MSRQATASDLPFYNIFAPQKVPFLKISDDLIACDLWFGPPPPPIKNAGYAAYAYARYGITILGNYNNMFSASILGS